MQVVCSSEHLRHAPAREATLGFSIPIHEVPARAEVIRESLAGDPHFDLTTPWEHGLDPLRAVHEDGLLQHLERAWAETASRLEGGTELVPDTFLHPAMREGMGPAPVPSDAVAELGRWVFDTATPIVEGTYTAARAAVDVALTGLDLVLAGAPDAYALCRPPGHHVARSVYGGYCYFNNAAIAAQRAVASGAARVTVLDSDYHHGNGTQQIFYDRGDVQYVSLHGDPNRAYPYYAGYAEETGAAAGRGTTLNLPLPAGIDDEAYLVALDEGLEVVADFDPEVLVVSLGVDTYRLDPIADFGITVEGFLEQGRRIGALERPTLVVQEGGYHVPDIGINVRAFLIGLLHP